MVDVVYFNSMANNQKRTKKRTIPITTDAQISSYIMHSDEHAIYQIALKLWDLKEYHNILDASSCYHGQI